MLVSKLSMDFCFKNRKIKPKLFYRFVLAVDSGEPKYSCFLYIHLCPINIFHIAYTKAAAEVSSIF